MVHFRDILFDRIYERFNSDVLARGVFLECLEPYILLDKLVSITPVVMKDFVDHYENKGMLQNVEACIVHLHIASLDIHQVCCHFSFFSLKPLKYSLMDKNCFISFFWLSSTILKLKGV